MTEAERLELELIRLRNAGRNPEMETKTRFDRFMTGLGDIVYGGAQLLENATEAVAPGIAEQIAEWDQSLYDMTNGVLGSEIDMDTKVAIRESLYNKTSGLEEGEFDGARLAGQVVSGLASFPARSLVGLATEGAIVNSAMPTDEENYWEAKSGDATIGAIGGAAARGISGAGEYVLDRYASPALAELRRQGVQPTVGQTIGGSVGKFEEAASSIPILGAMFQAPRGRALEEWQLGLLNDIVAPIGGKIDNAGVRGVAEAGDYISKSYKDAFELMPSMDIGPEFSRGLDAVFGQGIDMGMNEGAERAFRKIFNDSVASRLPRVTEFTGPTNGARNVGEITSENLKKMESELTAKINASGTDRQVKEALKLVRGYLRDQAGEASGAYRDAISGADSAYAMYKRLVKAANMDVQDGWTPGQLVRSTMRQGSENQSASGRAFMQESAMGANDILGNTLNDSGTTARAAAMALLGGGATAINPMTYGLAPLLSLGSTRAGQSFSNALMEYLMAPAMVKAPGSSYGLFANEAMD